MEIEWQLSADVILQGRIIDGTIYRFRQKS
jgi:hypothetical protein